MPDAPREQYWFLDWVAGWHQAFRRGLVLTRPEGHLTLDPLPGTATLLLDAERAEAEFTCPSGLAPDGCGRLLVVDATTDRVKRSHLASQVVETLPALGGEGREPRRLREPRGLALLPSGAIVVADTANHRIQIFSPATYALLQVWGATDQLGRPEAGQGPGAFRWPWAVAVDSCSRVYVVDRGNRRVQMFGADGTWLGAVGAAALEDPTRIALGPDGLVAVVDGSRVILFPPEGAPPHALSGVKEPRSVAFDDAGGLYVGTAIGLIYALEPDPTAPGGYRMVGAGVTGLDGAIVDLAWERSARELLAIIRENYDGQRQRLWRIDPAGGFTLEGRFITAALDSGIEGCRWHRVLLDATVPAGTSVEIDSYTAEARRPDGEVSGADFREWTPCVRAGTDNPDCLVQSGPGRYLWLRLTFRAGGKHTPTVRWLKAFFPSASYLEHLPAVYQEDEESRQFLERFLSIFQTEFDELDRRIDRFWQHFDPASTPERELPWLAGWLGLVVQRAWRPAKLRQMLKGAVFAARRRGTVAGLERAVEDYAGVRAKILEHFRLRRWPALSVASPLDGSVPLWSRDFYQRLQLTSYSQIGYFRLTGRPEPAVEPLDWGAHKFTVFFPADPYRVDAIREEVARVVEREKPAHTEATLCPVLPRFRVGVQATLGVDSVVGGVSHLVLNRLATLSYDSILACSATEQALRALGSAVRPQVGVTTKIA